VSTLAIIPTYLAQPSDLELVRTCLESLRKTAPECEVLLVDDHSPARGLVDEMEGLSSGFQSELVRKDENTGFSRTVNVGLARALEAGQHAVLVNADIEFLDHGWLRRCIDQPSRDIEEPAAVVGALLVYPDDHLIQHAGVFFSLLAKVFDHRYKYAPPNLPEALRPTVCPVTGALQFIRDTTLKRVGLYDENFKLGWEDVDYCLRVLELGAECVYSPAVRAIHHESVFRGRPSQKVADWQAQSWLYFTQKWRGTDLAAYIPTDVFGTRT
jgi:GT2 family glycosyltransferase